MNEKSDGAPDMNHPHLARIDMSEKPEGATDLGRFVFYAPAGVYLNAELSAALIQRALRDGPTYNRYGGVNFRTFEAIACLTSPVARLLIYQARYLLLSMPSVTPHLRVCMPINFGRSKVCAWYDPAYEGKFLSDFNPALPTIDPEEVL